MFKNNSQSIWVALSFLLLGLIVGILISTKTEWINSDNFKDSAVDAVEAPSPEDLLAQAVGQQVNVSVDDDAILGDPEAPLTIVEFSDYQCPWCGKFWEDTLPLIKEKYIDTGKVKLVYRDYYIPPHLDAPLAAEAAECVGKDDALFPGDENYYAMHDKLFDGQAEWSGNPAAKDVFVRYGDELGVDIRSCLDNGEMKEEVAADFAAARSYGVGGTPTFFVNGWTVVGAYPYEVFELLIERELTELK